MTAAPVPNQGQRGLALGCSVSAIRIPRIVSSAFGSQRERLQISRGNSPAASWRLETDTRPGRGASATLEGTPGFVASTATPADGFRLRFRRFKIDGLRDLTQFLVRFLFLLERLF